jgi:hypothetical protein
MTKLTKTSRPQPLDVGTTGRLAATARAVGQAIGHEVRGKHETQKGRKYAVDETAPTKLFWYRNGPWKRTELSRDVVAHNWPTIHSDFLTQVHFVWKAIFCDHLLGNVPLGGRPVRDDLLHETQA